MAVQNQFVASMFLYAVWTPHHVQEMNHIFFESGHSQQEGDSMHSCIKIAAKNLPVFSIENWRTICLIARTNSEPYKVHMIDDYIFLLDFKKTAYTILRNKKWAYRANGEGLQVKWNLIKWLKYLIEQPTQIHFKYNYDSEFSVLKVNKLQCRMPPN